MSITETFGLAPSPLWDVVREVAPRRSYSSPPEQDVGETSAFAHVLIRGQGDTRAAAIEAWKLDAQDKFAVGTGEWLVWRQKPEEVSFEDFATGRRIYQVSARAILPARIA